MSEDKKKLFQMIGGGLIITCAFAIMMPGLVQYLLGLWRIFALIALIVIVSVSLVVCYHRILKPKSQSKTENKSQD